MNIKDQDKYVLLINRATSILILNFQILIQIIIVSEILVLVIIFNGRKFN